LYGNRLRSVTGAVALVAMLLYRGGFGLETDCFDTLAMAGKQPSQTPLAYVETLSSLNVIDTDSGCTYALPRCLSGVEALITHAIDSAQ